MLGQQTLQKGHLQLSAIGNKSKDGTGKRGAQCLPAALPLNRRITRWGSQAAWRPRHCQGLFCWPDPTELAPLAAWLNCAALAGPEVRQGGSTVLSLNE